MSADTVELAVVGIGPRGLSVTERLCANAEALLAEGQRLLVHLIDPHIGVGGQVWRSSQDRLLLMNTVACQVTMFVDETVDCEGPVTGGPSLYDWALAIALLGDPDLPEAVRAEAAALGPDDYPSRAFYGCYLEWTLRRIVRTAPPRVGVAMHRARAVDVRDGCGGRQQLVLDDGRALDDLQAVVLALGHLPQDLRESEAALGRYAETNDLRWVPPSNPADVPLADLSPGEPVILRGMGLNFFDYLALLTAGRGGVFERRPDRTLTYVPSGLEPKLIVGSRRGIPYHARARNQKGAFGRHEPRYITLEVMDRLRARADLGAPADFRRDLWPLIDQEVRTVYYAGLVRQDACRCRAEDFATAFAQAGPAEVALFGDPLGVRETAAQAHVLDVFGIAPDRRWDWHRVSEPYGPEDLVSTGHFRRWLRDYVAGDLAKAQQGNVSNPLKAALDVMRDLRNEIRLLVDHGGLSGDAYRDDLENWYMPLNAFVSIGPPAERIEQFAALMDAGVLEPLGPQLQVECVDGRFVASSAACPDVTVAADTLIEARLPETDLRRTADPLLRRLLTRGECQPYRIPVRGGGFYVSGGTSVSRRPYHLIDVIDRPHPRRFAFGVPTEGVHWVTTTGIRPGVNSVILGDADAIARRCLGLATCTPEPVSPAWSGASWLGELARTDLAASSADLGRTA